MLEKEKKVAIKAAMGAGKKILGFYRKRFFVKMKGRFDFATAADFEAEKTIKSVISKSFPLDSFLAEESGSSGCTSRVWVVDPLDGTINFAHGIPWFGVSIALVEKGLPVLGVVFNPLSKELFFAEKGTQGAFCNEKKISVSKISSLEKSVVATGFPYERGKIARKTIQSISRLSSHVQGMRRFGSAVLDLCLLARGDFDGFFEYKLFPWDVCAAMLIVRNAGGKVTTFKGNNATHFSGGFVASNSLIHSELLKKLVMP